MIPGVKFEATNNETGAHFEADSNATGNYVLGDLPVGTYEVTATSPGFKKFVRQNLEVVSAQITRVDFKLQLGLEAIVEYFGPPSLLRAEDSEISHTITNQQADNLPVLTLTGTGTGLGNIRNPLQVVQTLAGASFAGDTVRFNGLPANTEAIRIDGQDATNGIWKQQTQIAQTGIDAIQEIEIKTSSYAPEFGQAGGGYINITTKSGTNYFHGGAYSYIVNEALNAGTPNTNQNGEHIRNKLRRLDYGFTLGGPIKIPELYHGHDKSWFFFNFEQFRERAGNATTTATVPTEDYRNGDLSQAGLFTNNQPNLLSWPGCTKNPPTGPCLDPLGRTVPQNGIYDPANTFPCPDGSTCRNLFAPFNVIPKTRFDPVAAAIQNLLPHPTSAALTSNYQVPAYTNYRHTTNPSFRLDHDISSKIRLSGYFSQIATQSPNANGFADFPFNSAAAQDDLSRTVRLNYDQTLSPTLLLHLGAGYLWTSNPLAWPSFDQSSIGLRGFYSDLFPSITGLSGGSKGGNSIALGPSGLTAPRQLWEEKPTANVYLTWVLRNHTYKAGLDLTLDGFVNRMDAFGNGSFGFSANQTSLPFEGTVAINNTTGFPYASFLLGAPNTLQVSRRWDGRVGNRAIGIYIQDNWKVTRKLAIEYGIRYDYQTYLKETYGRILNIGFSTPNPTVGRPGASIFEGNGPGRCNCQFGSNYPYAIGPRLGIAYQVTSKTVLRGGVGLSYGTSPENAMLSYNIGTSYQIPRPGYGFSVFPDGTKAGNPYAAGNPYGNPPIVWPNFDAGQFPVKTTAGLPPSQPAFAFDRNIGRPPRIFSWSIGLQRELRHDLVIEAYYLGNRGVWWTAPALSIVNQNGLRPDELLSRYNIDINKPADGTLLASPLNSTIAINRGFGAPAYAGMPLTQAVNQQLRPYPQFGSINSALGPPLGNTWYDALQAQLTKRYSHGLDLQAGFAWQKELSLGVNSSTSYFTPGPVVINDIFNRDSNKTLSSLSRPLQLVVSGTYTTPAMRARAIAPRILSQVLRDWQVGTVLRYQSGTLIQIPASSNGLFAQLLRSNPFFGSATGMHRNPGVPLWANGPDGSPIDPNCKCFDPMKQLLLNPAAWSETPPGQFGTDSVFQNDYRWQRQPSEALSMARNFRMGRDGKYNLQIRAEFQNAMNRTFLNAPTGSYTSPTTRNSTSGNPLFGTITGGFGYVNTINGAGSRPRNGQAVLRFSF